ncbi:cyclophilin-like fold protein [Micromonospora sp. NPDC005215]|uniref:cyclophilin-like fold protein n=1 Tax=unclassified Micromonospora TaxID=2617518 RepID=UPI0033AE7AC2
MRITLTVGATVLTGTLADNPTSRDFAALLPLTLSLSDHNRTEKISYLPRKLTTEGAPSATAATAGDLAYYAPWGNLAIFYRDFRRSPGLITIGSLDGGHELLPGQSGDFPVTIAHAD